MSYACSVSVCRGDDVVLIHDIVRVLADKDVVKDVANAAKLHGVSLIYIVNNWDVLKCTTHFSWFCFYCLSVLYKSYFRPCNIEKILSVYVFSILEWQLHPVYYIDLQSLIFSEVHPIAIHVHV